MNILITGGTGLVGNRITHFLLQNGHQVAYLSRKKQEISNVKVFEWDVSKNYIENGALEWANVIVHLAGAGIADERWTEKRKKEIIDSRTQPIELIKKQLLAKNSKIDAFISASAIGYYGGDTGEQTIDETSAVGSDFLANCTRQWEAATDSLKKTLGCRTVKIRIGIVLSKDGGALPKLLQPTQWGVGSALGTGKQWMSWIHIDDLARLFVKSIEDSSMKGIYNAVAPKPVRNNEVIKTIAKVLKRPLWLPNVPSFVLRLLLGEMSVVVLGGNFVENHRIPKDFFQFTTIKQALDALLKEK